MIPTGRFPRMIRVTSTSQTSLAMLMLGQDDNQQKRP